MELYSFLLDSNITMDNSIYCSFRLLTELYSFLQKGNGWCTEFSETFSFRLLTEYHSFLLYKVYNEYKSGKH